MIAGLTLQHFRFHLEPKVPLQLPAYNKGNVIRGGFGSAFRRIVCHAGCREVETCELKSVCPYTAVFQPFVPEGSEKISRNRDIPRPFVIKPPLETKGIYQPGERLSFDVVLVGKVKDYRQDLPGLYQPVGAQNRDVGLAGQHRSIVAFSS